MRSLIRVVVLTAALLAWPAAHGPAARAESATSCIARLNVVRARAGVPAASARGSLTTAAANHAAYRVHADLGDVPAGRSRPVESAHQETPGLRGYTGQWPWDRTRRAGLRDGVWRAQYENVTTIASSTLNGVRSWVDAPYHRFPMLDVNNWAAGCAFSTRSFRGHTMSAEVLELVSTWRPQAHRMTLYPAKGQTGVPTSFDRTVEHPSPFSGAATTIGSVVTVQADGYYALKVNGWRFTVGASHTPVAAHKRVRYRTGTWSGSVDTNLPANAAMLAATRPLRAGTEYHVLVSGYVKAAAGSAWTPFHTRAWSFTTAG